MKTGTSRIALVVLGFLLLALAGLYFLLGDVQTGEAALAQATAQVEQGGETELIRGARDGDGRAELTAPTLELAIPSGVRRPGTGTLSGRVLERGTGAPAPGLRVDLTPLPAGGPEVIGRVMGLFASGIDATDYTLPVATTASDAGGAFAFRGVEAGNYFIQARGAHHVPDVATPARVLSSGAGGPLDVFVRAGGRIVGVVVDAAERPVRGARVVVLPGVGALLESLRTGTLCSLEARTNDAGAFAVPGVPPGDEWEVTVTGPDLALSQVGGLRVRAGEDTEVRVLAGAGGVLTGSVLAVPLEGGAPVPVAGAQVGALPRGLRSLPFAREVLARTHGVTDAEGRYRLSGVPPGEVDVLGFAPGLLAAKGPAVLVSSARVTVAPDFLLERGPVVHGRVVDSAGVPLAGVSVHWEVLGGGGMDFDFSFGPLLVGALEGLDFPVTDAEGRFTAGAFPGTPQYQIEFEKQGYARTSLFWDGEQEELEVVLLGLCTIEGVVMNAVEHTPVTAFTIKARGGFFSVGDFMRSALGRGELQEHAQGRFSLEVDLPSSTDELYAGLAGPDAPEQAPTLTLGFSAPGYLPAQVSGIEITEGETTRGVIVEMYPGGVVRGTVADSAGTPVAGAQVFVRLIEQAADRPGGDDGARELTFPGAFTPYAASLGLLGSASVLSRPDGSFELRGVEPGESRLIAVHRDYALGASERFELTLEGPPAEVELVLAAGGVIHGAVSDRHGRSIPRAAVLAVSPSNFGSEGDRAPRGGLFEDRADETGHYRMEHVDAGVYFLVMARGDSALSPTSLLGSLNFNLVTVGAGEQVEYDIVDASAGATRVFGRITASDVEITRGQVIAVSFEGESLLGFDLKLARIAPDGTYEFEGLISGEYQFQLENLDQDIGDVELLVDIPDVPEHRLDLRLPDGRIEGCVTDAATGEPLAGIRVRAESSERIEAEGLVGQMMGSDTGVFSDWTGADGEYEFARLAAADYELVAGTSSWGSSAYGASDPLVVTLHTNEVQRGVDFRLSSALEVTVLVLDDAGQPVSGAQIWVRHSERPDDISSFGWTEEDGLSELSGLVRGAYDLTVNHEDFAESRQLAVELDPAADERLELHLVRGIEVTLLVLAPDGQPTSGGAARLTPVGGVGDSGAEAEALLKSLLEGSGVSGADGLLELGRFVPGEYELEVRRGPWEYLEQVVIPAGADLRLQARLR